MAILELIPWYLLESHTRLFLSEKGHCFEMILDSASICVESMSAAVALI